MNEKNKCKTKIPEKLKDKVCVRSGRAGIHAMINHVVDKNKVACAKKYEKKEVSFYNTINNFKNQKNISILIPFLPKYYYNCYDNGKMFFVMENLVKTSNTKFMDLKIGYKSAMRKEAGFIKYNRHYIIDRFFSTSSDYGFRLEGINFPIKNTQPTGKFSLIGKKYKRYIYHPIDVFGGFFEAKTNQTIIKNVDKTINQVIMLIVNFAIPNLEIIKDFRESRKNNKNEKIGIGLVGVSLFVTKSPKKSPKVNLIDFAHPIIINNSSTKKEIKLGLEEAENFLNGLEGILSMLVLYRNSLFD